jgi:hypothetical protein
MGRAALLLFLLCLPLAGWGDKGHRLIADGSLRTLPPGLGAWYAGQEPAFREAALDPDRWKEEDSRESARHFLRVEAYGGPQRVPFSAEEARHLVGASVFATAGQLPWAIVERYRRLVDAFRGHDPRQVVRESGWLCHYVADAQVPLKASQNHNGKKSGQKGIHDRWQKDLVEWKVEKLPELRPAHAPKEPVQAPWVWIGEAFDQVPGILEADREALHRLDGKLPGKPSDGPYWSYFWDQEKDRVLLQLMRSAERTGDILLAAWAEAGGPQLEKEQ